MTTRIYYFACCCAMLVAMSSGCSKGPSFSGNDPSPAGPTYVTAVSHGEIILGERLENPYTVENVKAALKELYPTKARTNLDPTDLYVRFLPSDSEQLDRLKSYGFPITDHPVDYSITQDGDYYFDPTLDREEITWQYSVVPKDFEFPSDIRYEIIDECYLADNASEATRASFDGVDWQAVEAESFRLTGNDDMLDFAPGVKGGGVNPSGRITVTDDLYAGGQPVGLAECRIDCNVFVKFSSTYTDRDGYYTIPKQFSARPRYRIVFKNAIGFSIGFNSILYPACVSTLGTGEASGVNCDITPQSGWTIFKRSAVNNSAYDYYLRCSTLGIPQPPSDVCIWTFDSVSPSSCPMLHHGTVMGVFGGDDALYKIVAWVVKLFSPDITLGLSDVGDYRGIYSLVVHELSHASHYKSVGNDYWNNYVDHILQSAILSKEEYGDESMDKAGYCAVGEMWAYYMQSKLYKERYGGENPSFGSSFWFHPHILTFIEDRGLSARQIFAALTPGVNSREKLRDTLAELYPSKRTVILQIFNRYD